MMAILSAPPSPISKSLQVSRSAASTATRAIAATTIRTGSRSGSAVKSGVSARPSATRCAGAPPSNRSSAISKQDHRMGRNYLAGRDGDRINAVLAAAGYNFSLLLRWFEELLRVLSLILCHALLAAPLHLTRCRKTFFTADLSSVKNSEAIDRSR